tara:strand:- start:8503 stop:9531 length:1029 start_codon:yes stop_codon:yes gene_type:complete
MPSILIEFNNSNIRTAQNITVEFQGYISADWSGGYVELAPPFGAKVKKTLTSSASYKFTREDKTLLDGSDRVVDDCNLNPTEVIKRGDFKKGKWIVNYKDAYGVLSSYSFLIKEPPIHIDYKVDVFNSTCRIYDKTNYKINNTMPKTNKYSLEVTAPAVMCSDTNTMGKTYTSPETWNSGSLIYINNRASKAVATPESDEFIITPIYNATYYIRYESEFTYRFGATEVTASTDSRAVSASLISGLLAPDISYITGPVPMGIPVVITNPSDVACDIWERIKDIDIKYKQSLCKNTILADKLRDILDRALQLYILSQQAMEIGNTALAILYLEKIIDITKTRFA